jgi:hypothetical protein
MFPKLRECYSHKEDGLQINQLDLCSVTNETAVILGTLRKMYVVNNPKYMQITIRHLVSIEYLLMCLIITFKVESLNGLQTLILWRICSKQELWKQRTAVAR